MLYLLLMRNLRSCVCAYVIILHVLTIDRIHGYGFCKRLLVLIETVQFTRVTMTTLVASTLYSR